jgi:uncharacterized protein YqfA (UPF0365 family)
LEGTTTAGDEAAMNSFGNLLTILLIVMFWVFLLVLMVLFLLFFRAWVRAIMNGFPVPLMSIITMRLRGVPPILLVDAYTALRRAGHETTVREVEETYLANRTRVRTSQDLIGLVKSKTASGSAAVRSNQPR